MMQEGSEELLASTANVSIAAPRSAGRPSGRRNNRPNLLGWHEEDESARKLGENVQTRRKKRRAGIGPKAWVREGRHVLYRDGCEEEYLAELLNATEIAAQPRRRGRPRIR